MSLGIAPCKVIWRILRVNQPLTRSGRTYSACSLHQVHHHGESLEPDGSKTLIGSAHGAYATLAQVPRYDPVPGPQLARPELQYGSLRRPVDEPSLFGETTLTHEWGRIGWPGQTRIALYENHTVAMAALEACSSASAVVATS